MIRVTSQTPMGARHFAIVVCPQGEQSEGHEAVEFDSGLSYAPKRSCVEVYDMTYRGKKGFHPRYGQFVTSYDLADVAGIGPWGWDINSGVGIDLCGSEEAWMLDHCAKRNAMLYAAHRWDSTRDSAE